MPKVHVLTNIGDSFVDLMVEGPLSEQFRNAETALDVAKVFGNIAQAAHDQKNAGDHNYSSPIASGQAWERAGKSAEKAGLTLAEVDAVESARAIVDVIEE